MLVITGSTGFIGRSISPHLPFPQRRLVSKKPAEAVPSNLCTYLLGDLKNPPEVDLFTEKASTLVHLASRNNPRNSNHRIQEHINQDLLSTLHLFETFAKKNPDGHIIFASTGGNMYHTGLPYIPRTEKDIPMPASAYGIQKLAAEHYLRLMCDLYSVKATVLRISNPYGTLLSTTRAHGLIGVAFSKILADEVLPIIDPLESVRDYLHLNDLIEAFCLTIKHPPATGEFRLFNVSSGIGHSLDQVLCTMEKLTRYSIKREYQSTSRPSPSLNSWSVLSYQHFYECLGWCPKIELAEGLTKMWKDIQYDRSILTS